MNDMTKLLDKIERRLGLMVIKLPDKLAKDSWASIIEDDTLETYSRYFPYQHVTLMDETICKNGYYFVDRDLPEGTKILGIKDIDWSEYSGIAGTSYGSAINFSSVALSAGDYGFEDIGMAQLRADYVSLFNVGIYPEFLAPNKVRLVSVNNYPISAFIKFPLAIFIKHPTNLSTISPTSMEIFERLAMADVATMLYNNLKYYDGSETVFSNLDLKLDLLNEWANKREDIVKELDEAHVSAANDYQSMIICQ